MFSLPVCVVSDISNLLRFSSFICINLSSLENENLFFLYLTLILFSINSDSEQRNLEEHIQSFGELQPTHTHHNHNHHVYIFYKY